MAKFVILAAAIVAALCAFVCADIASDVLSAMDPTANPCVDFYQFACGGWLKNATIPSDATSISRSFTTIEKGNNVVLKEILTQPSAKGDVTLQKILSFYSSCMNTKVINSIGMMPLVPLMHQLTAVTNTGSFSDIIAMLGTLHTFQVPAFFNFGVDIDAGNPVINIAQLSQGGITLPREIYLATDDESVELVQLYIKHITNMLVLTGESPSDANTNAHAILQIETKLAQISWSAVQMRDPLTTYNKIDIKGLEAIAPQVPWKAYLHAIGADDVTQANVQQPSFFADLGELLYSLQSHQQKLGEYLKWQLVHSVATLLSKPFVDENFAFFGVILQGAKEQAPRDDTCISATDSALGFILGRFYVDRKFSGNSKTLASSMIQGIEAAFHADLLTLDWMDDKTRAQAETKLSQVTNIIGYPAVWNNYTGLNVFDDQYYVNTMTSLQYAFTANLNTYGKPVDKNFWEMTPDTVNAYYEPTRNEMVFPAGILQNPYFDAAFPEPMRFGGAGVIMGHELTHGFDDQGRLYNGQGKLQDWWTAATAKQFTARAQCISRQYSRYSPLPGIFINGNLTLGENIADNGGVKDSFNALRNSIGSNQGNSASIVKSLTNFQLYFVAYAQGWCAKQTDASLKVHLQTDPHSPPKFRVIGPLSNSDDFATQFQCASGTPMNPTDKCHLW